jgi:hypothetical protein
MEDLFKILMTTISTIIALAVFIKGLIEYVKAQKWKKAEFVANQIKEFNTDANVRLAKLMLDWENREVKLFPEKEPIIITEELLLNALTPESYKLRGEQHVGFSEEEAKIRDIFDEFFDKLGIFNQYIEVNLIRFRDIKPYFTYWIQVLNGQVDNCHSKELILQISKYLKRYGYEDVLALLEKDKL